MGLAKRYQVGTANVGAIRPHHNTTAPAGWALCDGSSKTRNTLNDPVFQTLIRVAPAATTTSGSATLTLHTTINGLQAGCLIEGTGIPSGTTVSSSTGTVVTMSANATATGTIAATFLPHGAADSSSFNLPKLNGRVPLATNLSYNLRAGYGSVDLTSTHLPYHTHVVSDPGHYHDVADYGLHRHGVNGAGFAVPSSNTVSIGSGATASPITPTYGSIDGGFTQSLFHSIGTTNAVSAATASTGSATVADVNIQPTRSAVYIIRVEI